MSGFFTICIDFNFAAWLMYDQWLGPGCFPSQLRGRKTEMAGEE